MTTNKQKQHLPTKINDSQIPYAHTAKYLGMILDDRLRWRVHDKKKWEELGIKLKNVLVTWVQFQVAHTQQIAVNIGKF